MKQKLWELIWLTALIFSSISAHAATRIALVSSCGGAAGADVLALAEARLSQQPDMAIVERREVERILQEQQLWQRGRTDYTQALSAGKLLGVDVFVSLEMFPDSKDVLGLIIFDASNGVRLWDAALPSGELEQKAKAIQEAVRIACAKRERTQENFRTVCLVTVRNADLPRELDNLCDTVGVLLERNLTSSTNLLVLERRRLEQVTRERGLPTGEVTSNLFASVTLLEIEVARGSSNRTLQAMALLSTASGKVIDKVSIQSGNQNPVELADSLLAKLLTALHAAQPAQPVDRLAETKRFQEEAKFQFWQRDFVHAITTAEAALALMPEEQTFFPTFFTCLSSAIRQLLASPNRSDWEYALRLIRRLQDMVKIGSQECDPAAFDRRANVDRAKIDQEKFNSDLEKYKIASSGRSCLISCLSNARRYDFGNDRQLQERLAAIQEDHRRWLLESINQLHPAGTASLSAFLRYSQAVFGSDAELGSVARSPREWTTDAIALRAKWIALAQDYLNHENAPESSLQGCLHNFVPAIGQPESRLRNSAAVAPAPFKLTAEDCTLWRAYFRSIDQDPSAILRFYGTLGELWADINAQSVSTNEATRRTESLVALAKEMITRVDAQTDFIQSGYRGALDAIEYFPTEPQRYQARLALVDFMLSRCELSEIVVRAPGSEEVFKNVARLLEQSALRPLGNDCSGFIREHYGTDGKTNSVGPAVPWINARLLFDGQSRGAKGIKALAHDAEHVYLVVDRNDLLQLVCISLGDGQVKILREDLGQAYDHGNGSVFYPWAMLVHAGMIYYQAPPTPAGHLAGLRLCPLAGGPIRQITQENNLPSSEIGAFTDLDGKLYAALAGGYIIAHDLQSGQTDVLASSRRREAKSALDNYSPPFEVGRMITDRLRHRVLFTVDGLHKGLWEIDSQGKIRQLFQGSLISTLGPYSAERQFYGFATDYFIRFDMDTDQAEVDSVAGENSYHVSLTNAIAIDLNMLRLAAQASTRTPSTAKTKTPTLHPRLPSTTQLFVDGWLWTYSPFGRTSVDGLTKEIFPKLGQSDGGSYWIYHELVGNGRQVLVFSGLHLWLLSLPPQTATKNP